MRFDRVAKWQLRMDAVAVSASLALALENIAGFEFGDDLVNGTFSDADRCGNIAQAHLGVIGQADQDVSVIGKESPRGGGFGVHLRVDEVANHFT